MQKPMQSARVTAQRTLEKSMNFSNRAILGDYIELHVHGLKYLIDSVACGQKDSIILYLNNYPLRELHPVTTNLDYAADTGSFVFYLDRKVPSVIQLNPYFYSIMSAPSMRVSAGVKDKPPLSSDVIITVRMVGRTFMFVTIAMFLGVIILFVIVSRRSNILRAGASKTAPFSLAKSQLAFWTVLVSFSFLYLWLVNGEMPVLPESVLILLGISLATTSGGFYIDTAFRANENDQMISDGFLRDVLSDNKAINIQRVQMFLWTLILGFIFFHSVLSKLLIPDFDTNLLALMGISSGAYVLLKTVEKKGVNPEVKKESPPATA